MTAPGSAIVVGGGLVGLSTAAELIQRGVDVTVLDAGEFARQASWAGGGILSPLAPWSEPAAVTHLTTRSLPLTQQWTERLQQEPGIDCEFWRCGMRIVDAPQQAIAWSLEARASTELDGDDLVLPDVAQLRTPRYGRGLVAWLRARGARLLPRTAVSAPVDAQSVRAGDTVYQADVVCLCAGPWSSQLMGQASNRAMIRPIKGQMLLFAPGSSPPPTILRREAHYLIPRKDGRTLVGSTLEDVGFDDACTSRAREDLHAAALRMWPALEGVPVERQWSGLRPMSRSGLPVIGRHLPSGLWLNTGHYRNGVTLAAGSAALVAAAMFGDAGPEWAGELAPTAQLTSAA